MILSGKITSEKKAVDPVEAARKIADDLRKEFADKESAREEATKKAAAEAEAKQKADLEAAYGQYREEVTAYTKENTDKYELINMFDQQELVIDTVNGYYEKHKRVLSVQEACDMVEAYLDSEAQKVQKAKKYNKAEATTAKKVVEETSASAPAKSKTLSNNMTPTTSSILPAASEAERMKRALAALNTSR
jgi:hypothetical protein